MKQIYLALLILILNCFSKSKAEALNIKFDYSNLKTGDININKLIKKEFDYIRNYISNLIEFKSNSDVYKKVKNISNSKIKCENGVEYKFKKNDIENNISLLVIPSFNINSNTKNGNIPVLNECLHSRNKALVITLDFEFK